ncbi:MAG TPA: holo-ACP synthase [Candidatus Limnocylindria bacterium]|jgi:holo-[acyl-carrier protein] synthase|nr:holo-ACP synthase [Candidatus Limnocylindria bacterium]
MAIHVGVDLAAVRDVEDALSRHGERYLRRIYTDAEILDCQTPRGMDPRRLASLFAAKEATIKVLSADTGLSMRDIAVCSDATGRARLKLGGTAADLAHAAGLTELVLGLTRSGDYAAAVVLAESE